MKKLISFFLMAVMLLTMIPSFAVSAAEPREAERTPLHVTFVSGTHNLDLNSSPDNPTYPDWSKTFDPTNTTRIWGLCNTDIEIVGKFDEPTPITSFVIRSNYYRQRLNGTVVLFSKDGETWENGITMQEERAAKDGACDVEIRLPKNDTAYSYVKVLKSGSKMLEYNGNSGWKDSAGNILKGTYLDIHRVTFFNEPENATSIIEANHLNTIAPNTVNMENVFNSANRTLARETGKASPIDIVDGKFLYPTVISDIYIDYDNARINGTIVQASTDGVTWKDIASVNVSWPANAGNPSDVRIGHIHVNDSTPYQYVRLRRNHTLWGGEWHAYSFYFAGTELNTDTASMTGYQVRMNENDWDLRLIATVGSLDIGRVGYEISVTGDGIPEQSPKTWDESTTTVYEGIYETPAGQTEPVLRSARSLGGYYIFTATINKISFAEYGNLTFTVKPYVMNEDGEKQYGETVVYTLNDGVTIKAE